MKKIFLILAVLAIGFTGCHNDDDASFTNTFVSKKSIDEYITNCPTCPLTEDEVDVEENKLLRKVPVKPCKIWNWREDSNGFSYQAIGIGDDGVWYEYVKIVTILPNDSGIVVSCEGRPTNKRC